MPRSSNRYIRCHHCGHRVYHQIRRCPHCQHPMRRIGLTWFIAAIIAVVVTLAVANWMSNVDKPPPPPPEINTG